MVVRPAMPRWLRSTSRSSSPKALTKYSSAKPYCTSTRPLTRVPSITPSVPAVTLNVVPSCMVPSTLKLPGRSGAAAVRSMVLNAVLGSSTPTPAGSSRPRASCSAGLAPTGQDCTSTRPAPPTTLPAGRPAPVVLLMSRSNVPPAVCW